MPLIKRLTPLLVAVPLLGGLVAPLARASSSQEAIIQDDAILRANMTPALATMRLLGATRVKVSVNWSRIAPSPTSSHRPANFDATDPSAYPAANWSFYDQVVEHARAEGLPVVFMVTGPAPLWAAGRGMPKVTGCPCGQWKPSESAFRAFVRAVGTRYGGGFTPLGASAPLPRVGWWSIWNEPNYGPNLAPQAIDHDTVEVGAVAYRGLLDAAWAGLRSSGHRPGRDTILIGETAPRGLDHPIGDFSGVKPLRFLRALYCVDRRLRPLRGAAARARSCPTTAAASRQFRSHHPALFSASGYADHPYAQGVPPDVPTYACGHSACWNPKSKRSDPDYADFPEIGRLERTLDKMNAAYGSRTHYPIYSTEYGYWTKPPDPAATIGQATAATYLNWAEYLSYKQPRVRSYSQYLLVDPPLGNFATGLELPNGTPKLTFAAYQLPIYLPRTRTSRSHNLEVWGAARPAHFALMDTGIPQTVAIQFKPAGASSFTTLRTVTVSNSRGYVDVRQSFTSSGSVRLEWTPPAGTAIDSRAVAVKVTG